MKINQFIIMLLALSACTTITLAQTKGTDSELKSNIMPVTGALSAVNQLEPVTYQYDTKQNEKLKLPAGTQYGFNTANVQSVLPGVVKTESVLYPAGKNQFRSVDVTKVDMQSLIPVLLSAIKEQQAQIDALKAEVQALQKAGKPAVSR